MSSTNAAVDASNTVVDVSGLAIVPVAPKRTRFKYKEIEADFQKSYNTDETNNSTICDIIAMYVKGQKILYTEAKTHCEQRLTCLMLPAIFITVVCSVIGVILKDYTYGTTLTSSLNGVNAFLLALISYLKLDTRAEAHRTSAYKFDKLQSYIEFSSGKQLFVTEASQELGNIIETIEKEVREIKETNQFVLPEKIRFTYPNLCNSNVFAMVKKLQAQEMVKTNQLKDLQNERLTLVLTNGEADPGIKDLDKKINDKINDIIGMKKDYLELDKDMAYEIEQNIHNGCCTFQLCGWFKV